MKESVVDQKGLEVGFVQRVSDLVEKSENWTDVIENYFGQLHVALQSEEFFDLFIGRERGVYVRMLDSYQSNKKLTLSFHDFMASKSQIYYNIKQGISKTKLLLRKYKELMELTLKLFDESDYELDKKNNFDKLKSYLF